MSGNTEVTGAVVNLAVPDEGETHWSATQTPILEDLMEVDYDDESRVYIDWAFGPTKFLGYVEKDTFGMVVAISVAGVYIGTLNGNLKDGMDVDVDLLVTKGSIKFYLKRGNEIWIHLDIKVTFNGSYEGDWKLGYI
ncbi:hypothetical protein VMCG_10607 [Cytospora schulzeri]|uniref:Uncharacterized protein n=1 Tax=Cytospora schulzeri TaxID=448051 RepID=A0A423V9N8_9PEZI|nr:hypothetical protein VMCG_10607 [Valsa malicola]